MFVWRLVAAVAGLVMLLSGAGLFVFAGASPLWLRALCAGAGAVTGVSLGKCLSPRKRSVSHGSAGFAGTHEREPFLFDSVATLPVGAVILGADGGRVVALTPPHTSQHGVIVGGSGTGKSFSFFLPNMANARHISCVATDPKSELWHYTAGFHRRAVRYAPTDPDKSSAGFNWIPLCADARTASLCARTIVEAGETTKQEAPWPDLETAFLAALFSHTATLAVPTPLTAYRLLTRTEPGRLMAQFAESSSWTAREQAVIFLQTHERMRGSITPVLAAKLQFLRDENVARFTSSNFAAPDFGRLKMSPTALYWCVPEQDMALLKALSALFFTVLMDQIARVETAADGATVPVHLYLDEFANIGILPRYETTISLARGRGLSLWHGLQSLSQLEGLYGKANAQTILTNCATKIALSGLDVETAHYFSRTLGEATVGVRRPSWSRRRFALFASSVSVSDQEHARSLMTPDEIRRIGEGKALVVTGNRRPLLIKKCWYEAPPKAVNGSGLGKALAADVAPLQKTSSEVVIPPDNLPPVFRMTTVAVSGECTKPLRSKQSARTRHARSTLVTKQ